MKKSPAKTVWVTKTGADAKSHPVPGFEALYRPLLEIIPADTMPALPEQDDVIVFTSGNAVAQFCRLTDRRHWHVLTVGDATAAAASACGFSSIRSAGKNIEALVDLIAREIPASASIYYASARDISADLVAKLAHTHKNVKRAVLYATRYLKPAFAKPPDVILLYSPRGAKALIDTETELSNAELISISTAVDIALTNIAAESRKIAENPTHDSMIKQLVQP